MKGPLALLIAATLCLGCQAPPGAIDPFIGRQTVPPPGTATPTTQPPGDEYYSNAPKTSGSSGPSPSNSPYAPPGGFRYRDDDVATRPETAKPGASIPGTNNPGITTPATRYSTPTPKPNAGGAPVKSANPGERPPAATSASRSIPSSGFQVNNNPTRGLPATTASTRSTATGTRAASTQPAKDITTLPDARPASKTPASRESGGFRPPGSVTRASFDEDVSETTSTKRTPRRETIGSPGAYDQDKNYRWLKGRLEYSRTDDRWKLRYIPIDGETDEFGGSVVLLGSRLLEGYKPGEYVTIYGTLGETDARGVGYAPTYQLDRVQRQAEE
jgi:hypothetical protein